MGNHISFHATTKIIYYDGSVQEFDQPITVAELMLDHPKHVVVEFHSAMNQKKPTPLPADKNLEMNKKYVMVPMKPGKPVGLSAEDCSRILSIANSALNTNNYLMSSQGFVPWLVRFLKKKKVEIGEVETSLQINEEERFNFCEFLPEMVEERAEYLNLSRQLSGKGWKPSLDTIKEKKVKRKISGWLFLTSFIGAKI
uniref:Multidrug resistance protein ABC transporter family protein n=1 Tax=Medicago truncatula TaxID=3880 RepID=I3T980_MEDTR|nr:unknown [Medicago truncatula]